MAISKIKDPARITTDPALLSHLAKIRIDKDFVQFEKDYGTLVYRDKRGRNRRNYYSKRYRDLKTGKQFHVIKSLPMCRQDGTRLTPGWERGKKRYYARTNLFEGEVSDSGRIAVSPTNDQPSGMLTSDTLIWQPQLYLGGMEVEPVGGLVLLETDPVNSNYQNNTLEWDYGICKRRIRTIEGRLFERWIFFSNPGSDVRIVHNHEGKQPPRLGEHQVSKDEELVPLNFFQQAEYPVEIAATYTLYPDADPESTCCDGFCVRGNVSSEDWATIKAGDGTNAKDDEIYLSVQMQTDPDPYWNNLGRSITVFDASAASGSISTTTLSFYGYSKKDDCNIAPAINVYSANPASNTAVVAADFTTFGTTKFCDDNITYAEFSTAAGYNNEFSFNSTGINFVQNAIDDDGIVKLGVRDAIYDAGTSTPTHPGSNDLWTHIRPYSADQGSGYEPKLVIETLPDVEEPVSVTLELEASTGKEITAPASSNIEIGAYTGKELALPVHVTVGLDLFSELIAGFVDSVSVTLGLNAETGKELQFPVPNRPAWHEKAPKLEDEGQIRSLAVYNNKLYGGTATHGKLYEWNGTDAWVEKAPTLGSVSHIYSLAVYNNKLYGGTYPYGRLYEWNGTDAWIEKAPTLGDENNIYSLAVYNNKLYGGTRPNGKLYEWNGTDAWIEKAPTLGSENHIYSLAVYNNKLYGGTGYNGKLYEWNGTDAWIEKAPTLGDETIIFSLAVYNNKLYGGTYPNGKLYEWNGTDAWVEKAPKPGSESYIYSLAVYNGKLYGGTRPNGKLYEWNGTDAWVEKAPTLGDEIMIFSLAVYNNKLYGGTGLNGKLLEWGNEVLLALDAETGCFAGVEFPVEVILGLNAESGKHLTLQANPVLGLQALADLNLTRPAFALLGLDVYSEKAIVLFVLNDVLINIWEEEKRVN